MSSSNTNPLPFAVREALIQACGTVFHWKRGLIQLFVSAGVPEPAVTRYRDEVKYVIARSVLADLDGRGAAGRRVQWQIVDSMLGLTGPADGEADPTAAKAALKHLREAAGQRTAASANSDEAEARSRKRRAELERKARERQSETIAALRTRFFELENERDPKKRGFAFERFLADLFRAFDIEYRGSYGGFTRSSQHLDARGGDGQAGWVDEGVDGPLGDEVAGQAVASVRGRAVVLA